MRTDAEIIYQALFNLVSSINSDATPLKTMSRRWVKWDQIGDIPMPAFFQMEPPNAIDVSQTRQFGPSRYRLHAELWIYLPVDTGDLITPTSPALNAYFNAIDDVLGPVLQSPGGARQQLGLGPGGVENCYINGTVIMDEGLTSPPAILNVPISIVCG